MFEKGFGILIAMIRGNAVLSLMKVCQAFIGAIMKKEFLVWAGVLGLLLVPVKESKATQYKLNTWNISDKSTSGKYVNIDTGKDSKGHTILTVSIGDGKGLESPTYIKDVSFNSGNTNNNLIRDANFGSFDNEVKGGSSNGSSIKFTFDKVVDFTPNNLGNIFLVHTDVNKDGNPEGVSCNIKKSVPEPSSLLLLGSGLIGLAFLGRKKFNHFK